MDEDLRLLTRWTAGDATAGRDLVRRHFDEIYRFFEHKVGGDADDLVQRTFTAVVESRERFRGASSFRTYLFAIARNQLYAYLRRLPRAEHVDFEDTSISALVTSLGSRLDRAREIEVLRAVLRQLPAEQQLLLELHLLARARRRGARRGVRGPARGDPGAAVARARRAPRAHGRARRGDVRGDRG